jgi:hypothetical protein
MNQRGARMRAPLATSGTAHPDGASLIRATRSSGLQNASRRRHGDQGDATTKVVSLVHSVAVSQGFEPPSLAIYPWKSKWRMYFVGKFTDWNELPEPLLPTTGQKVESLLKTTLPSWGWENS